MPSKEWKDQQPQSKSKQQSVNEIPQSQTALGNQSSPDEQLEALFNQATQIITGLQAGENHNAASIVLAEAENFRHSATKLAEVVEFYRNPDARVAMAYVIAGQNIANQQSKKFQPQMLALTVPPLELPGLPNFSRFYPSSDLSQLQLTDGSSSNESNNSNQNSEATPVGN